MKIIIAISLVALFSVSCTNGLKTEHLPPTPDQPLGEFEEIASLVDLSKTNQFNESLFCNTWVIEGVLLETYLDGVYENTRDVGDRYSKEDFITFRSNHTLTTYGGGKGIWLYSHNYLFYKLDGSNYVSEVVKSEPGILHLKSENYPRGGKIVPFHTDPSGKHTFLIWEYVAK